MSKMSKNDKYVKKMTRKVKNRQECQKSYFSVCLQIGSEMWTLANLSNNQSTNGEFQKSLNQ